MLSKIISYQIVAIVQQCSDVGGNEFASEKMFNDAQSATTKGGLSRIATSLTIGNSTS